MAGLVIYGRILPAVTYAPSSGLPLYVCLSVVVCLCDCVYLPAYLFADDRSAVKNRPVNQKYRENKKLWRKTSEERDEYWGNGHTHTLTYTRTKTHALRQLQIQRRWSSWMGKGHVGLDNDIKDHTDSQRDCQTDSDTDTLTHTDKQIHIHTHTTDL